MGKIWMRIVDEPAMVVVIVVALINTFFTLDAGQVDSIELIIENVMLLLTGGAIRQAVTPVSKLKRKGIQP